MLVPLFREPTTERDNPVPYATARLGLAIIDDLKDKIYSKPTIPKIAENAYRQMVADNVFKDLHNTSTAAVEKLIDDILDSEHVDFLQNLLAQQNPNLLAFLHIRLVNAQAFLREQVHLLLPVEDQPKLVARWALIDLWTQSPDSSDPY